MRKLFTLIFAIIVLICLISCSNDDQSSFSIQFIDVGQGDAALVECDGHYMLIDGGDTFAGETVYNVLKYQGVNKLDMLVMSHLHADHIGGLPKALTYISDIGCTLSNSDYSDTKVFKELEHELYRKSGNGSKITVPAVGDAYDLGSATVEVIASSSKSHNDSLVLLITYGKTRFVFSGDIEENMQTNISDKYENDKDQTFDIDLIKMPHHGAYTGTLYRYLRTFMPEYAIISVGDNNYGHPQKETLDLLSSKGLESKIYRTDINGDIVVRSDGKELSFELANS